MGFIIFTILKRMYRRCQIYRRLNHLERIKLNSIRRKHRLQPIYTYWDMFCDIICFPFVLTIDTITDAFERFFSSITSRGRKRPQNGQMRRVFKNLTDENKLLRKIGSFLFGLFLTYMLFLFLYYQHFLNNYPLIGVTIASTIFFTLIVPFNDGILCLILIALPSLFSSNVRYVLAAFIIYSLYYQVFPNIWGNGKDGIRSFGCSVYQTGKGSKQMAGLLVSDIKKFAEDMKQKMKNIIENLRKYLKAFDLGIKLPALHLKSICNEPTEKDVYNCEDKITIADIGGHRLYPPLLCTHLWSGFANLCQETKEVLDDMYKNAREELLEAIEKLERELYFDVDLNHDFDYHYNTSDEFSKAFKRIGEKFMEKHWFLAFLPYLLNIKVFILLIFTIWIIVVSAIYRFRFLTSDAFDNTYINKELYRIDRLRLESRKETIIPLDMEETKRFINPFDPIMTPIEFRRFLFGISIFSFTLGQILLYFALDFGVYYLVHYYNTFIDILADIFVPSSMRIDYKGNSFIAKRLNLLNDGFDIKNKIIQRLQECKSIPLGPNGEVYRQILFYLFLILVTLFSSAYGLRLRHYFAGIFYPHRVPIRAIWLYNNILCRRGNIFQFFRKQMRKSVFGEKVATEDVSILDRLCAQFALIRIVCKLFGVYGDHKYCKVCGIKVMKDGSDQSVRCVHNCGAIYCFDCFGNTNNICSVCMNPIDYTELGEISEELDSSEEDVEYDLKYEDFLYQYEEESKSDRRLSEEWDVYDAGAFQRRDLIKLAYRDDTVEKVPPIVYLVDDEEYDAEDESEDYPKYLFNLEQELGIPAEHILLMKQNAKQLVAEDMDNHFKDRVKEEKYSQLKREDDQRLVKNALKLVNRDRRKYIKKSQNKFN